MGFVYALRYGSENLFKIGRTKGKLANRIKELATGSAHRITPFDHIETEDEVQGETYVKGLLRSKRSRDSEGCEIYRLSEDEVRGAMRETRTFLEEFVPKERDAQILANETSDGTLLKPSDQDWERYSRILDLRVDEDSAVVRRKLLEIDLKLVIGRTDGLERLATWKSHTVERFDATAFRDAEPKLFEKFVRTSVHRRFSLQ
jgi:hypothetical protein